MTTHSNSHDEVARAAAEIWNSRGRPEGADVEIWLEAERQVKSRHPGSTPGPAETEAAPLAERVREETAAESVAEYLMPANTPKEKAIKAAVQNQNPKASKEPDHTARPGNSKGAPATARRS